MADNAELDDETHEEFGTYATDHTIDLGPLPTFPGYLFRQAQIRVYQGLYPILASFGIRPTQFGVMIILKYNPGTRPSEVAAALGLKRANFVPLLDDLRARGYAEAQARVNDRRSRALYLTPKGSVLLSELQTKVQAYEDAIMDKIDPERTGLLLDLVTKLM